MARRFFFPVLLATFVALGALRAEDDLFKNAPPNYINAIREAIRTFNARDFENTLKSLDEAEKFLPPNAITLNVRGATLIEQKQFEKGAEYCRKAIELEPNFYPARFNLCEIPLVQKRCSEARTMFEKLFAENPKDELVQYRILLTWLLDKNDVEARRVLDAIPFPGSTPAYYYGNAAWEFAHGNQVEGGKWVTRGNWVFKSDVTQNFSQPFVEIGWLKQQPPTSATLPELEHKETAPPAKLELAQPAPEK